jgi:nitrite reductase (NADH) large subunit
MRKNYNPEDYLGTERSGELAFRDALRRMEGCFEMKVIIIGNNVAGITTAKTLREMRQDIDIIVFAEERYHYYSRPMLIEFIASKADEKALPFYPEDWYQKNRIKVNLGTKVEKIDTAGKKALAGGQWYDYDALIIATGARSFVPPIKGLPKQGVFTIRTLEDAKAVKALIPKVKSVVIIGGGLLGLESAKAISLARSGISVKVLEKANCLLSRQLDEEGGKLLRALVEEMGVDVITNADTEEIVGNQQVEKVKLKDGREIEAQMVIISAGVRPNLELVKDSGLKIEKGLIVDSGLCCDRSLNIYAAGDVVQYEGTVWGIIPAALDQAKIVARMIVGQSDTEYHGTVVSNTLKVMGIDLTSTGMINPPDGQGYEEIRAKSDDGRVYKKFILKDGKIVGAIILGSRKEVQRVSKLIRDGTSVEGLKGRMKQIDFDFSGL